MHMCYIDQTHLLAFPEDFKPSYDISKYNNNMVMGKFWLTSTDVNVKITTNPKNLNVSFSSTR